MTEYLYTEGKSADNSCPIKVRVDGDETGQIIKVLGGFQYVVKGEVFKSDVFTHLWQLQKAIES